MKQIMLYFTQKVFFTPKAMSLVLDGDSESARMKDNRSFLNYKSDLSI